MQESEKSVSLFLLFAFSHLYGRNVGTSIYSIRWMVSYTSSISRNGVKNYWIIDEKGKKSRVAMKDIPEGVSIEKDGLDMKDNAVGRKQSSSSSKVQNVPNDPFALLKETRPWDAGRALMEKGSFEDAHALLAEAIGEFGAGVVAFFFPAWFCSFFFFRCCVETSKEANKGS